ncbi:MAG: hypothetical protein AAGI11_00720 [Pseudomonadota bacterium]
MTYLSSNSFSRFLLGLALLVLAACGTNSSITHSYVDPKASDIDAEGVLIVAVASNAENRTDFEDAYARSLSRHGIEAVASHTLLPSLKAESEDVIAAAEQADLGTILVVRYVGDRAEEVYHPGTVYYGVMPAYGVAGPGYWGGYYGHAYEIAYEQPVWTTNRIYTLISDLFVTETREHIWQAVSDTVKAGGDRRLRDDIIASFVGDLKDQGLL